ncbi:MULTISPECIES: DUF3891 family protein [Allobacillus]|uniref:DUF3891 family protein n=1 Tax=Allobacillus salarius TaxID=1955272 RepID=A0A556P6F7_9BACI|nr:DUF3891 family protein [Allobacillus salarius]TSJ59983.1 DUF3891 family protein [Allobacillus salarius]
MIVTKNDQSFRMFTQHDHAKVSGEIAKHWPSELFLSEQLREEVELAITQHDRAWIPLDDQPTWNEEKHEPHSFMNYPLEPKLEHYQKGVDEVRSESKYAGLLCSHHYLSFFDHSAENPIIQQYISREMKKNNQIKKELGEQFNERAFDFHFHLLQFCDDLSLYFCLNEPGIDKENETKMFKHGFRQQFQGMKEKMVAYWEEPNRILLNNGPFKETFSLEVPYKEISKAEIDQNGLKQAYELAETKVREAKIESD